MSIYDWMIEMFYENLNNLVEEYKAGDISQSAFTRRYERLVEDKATFRKEMYINE